jgi:hypothetical protein
LPLLFVVAGGCVGPTQCDFPPAPDMAAPGCGVPPLGLVPIGGEVSCGWPCQGGTRVCVDDGYGGAAFSDCSGCAGADAGVPTNELDLSTSD